WRGMRTHRPAIVIACGDGSRVSALAEVIEDAVGADVSATWPVADAIKVAAAGEASVLVLDAPLRTAELRALADVTASKPDLGVLVVGAVDAPVRVMVVLASGALGYVPTDSPPAVVAEAVAALVAGETVLPSAVSRPLVEHLRDGGRIVVRGCGG